MTRRKLVTFGYLVILPCLVFFTINLVQGRNILSFIAVAASQVQPLEQGRNILSFVPGAASQVQPLEQLIGKPSAQQIQIHDRALSIPHEAGTDANVQTAKYYADRLREYGFDEVLFNHYEVLLPRPIIREVTLLEPEQYNLKLIESPISSDPDSYAADGDITAPVVYVNYGRKEDYALLDKFGISVKGKIVIARYGRAWRGIKSRLAAEHGAIGCLLYSDPADDGYVKGKVIPQGKWRPEFGVQSGSVLDITNYPGDPQTPTQASKPGVQRLPLSKAVTLEKIPVLPISYSDALPILRNLDGEVVPKEWQGGW